MLLKVIFLSMLCIPIGYFQYYLILDAAKDVNKSKRTLDQTHCSGRNEDYVNSQQRLRIAK